MTKTAILTGISSGLGKEIALKLVELNYIVIGISRKEIKDKELKKIISDGHVFHVSGDVSNSNTVQCAFKEAEKLGSLDLIINCAGYGVFGPAGLYSKSDIQDVLNGNLIGTMLFSDKAFEQFKEKGGTIVNIMSTAAHNPRANETIYCAAKWGERGYTEALRAEAKNTPVRIFAVYPGGMNTNFWNNIQNVDSSKFMNAIDVAEIIINNIFSKKSCHVSDIVINRN